MALARPNGIDEAQWQCHSGHSKLIYRQIWMIVLHGIDMNQIIIYEKVPLAFSLCSKALHSCTVLLNTRIELRTSLLHFGVIPTAKPCCPAVLWWPYCGSHCPSGFVSWLNNRALRARLTRPRWHDGPPKSCLATSKSTAISNPLATTPIDFRYRQY